MKYWIIRLFLDDEDWDESWKRCCRDGLIPMGWAQLGDMSQLDQEDRRAKIKKYESTESANFLTLMFRYFYDEIKVDDIVLYQRGRRQIVGAGRVLGKAFFNADKTKAYRDIGYVNFLPIDWRENFEVFDAIEPTGKPPPMLPILEVAEERFRELMEFNEFYYL